MKKIYTTLILLAFTIVIANAQTTNVPNAINFQAIARDSTGHTVTGNGTTLNIQVRFVFIDSAAGATGGAGSTMFSMTWQKATDAFGQFSVDIQNTNVAGYIGTVAGTLAGLNAVPWETGKKYIKIEYQSAFSASWTNLGTVACNSTFYAFHSRTAEKLTTAGTNGQVLKMTGGQWVAGTDNNTTYVQGNGITINGDTIKTNAANGYAVYQEAYTSASYPLSTSLTAMNSWVTIPLNTAATASSTSDIVVSSAGAIQLNPGTYRLRGFGQSDIEDDFNSGSGSYMYLGTQVVDASNNPLIIGTTERISANANYAPSTTLKSNIEGIITVSAPSTYYFQRYVKTLTLSGTPSFYNYVINSIIFPPQAVASQLSIERIK